MFNMLKYKVLTVNTNKEKDVDLIASSGSQTPLYRNSHISSYMEILQNVVIEQNQTLEAEEQD